MESIGGVPASTVRSPINQLSSDHKQGFGSLDGRVVEQMRVEGGHQIESRYGGVRLATKRVIDVTISIVVLLVMAPLMMAIAIAVMITSPGPALFSQERIGRHGRRFRMFKFRTMVADADRTVLEDPSLHRLYRENAFKIPADEDHRLTGIGRPLRRASLDELPQLFNVLAGHMSLVGPRPIVDREQDSYGELISDYLAVYPGITGQWQVSGRSAVRYPERAEIEADYARTWSLSKDIRILLRTVPEVLRCRGAY